MERVRLSPLDAVAEANSVYPCSAQETVSLDSFIQQVLAPVCKEVVWILGVHP